MMNANLLQMIEVAVSTARMWDEKGDANWAARSYVQAALCSLRAAVKLPNPDAGRTLLLNQDAPMLLDRSIGLSQLMTDGIAANRYSASMIGGNYHLSVLAHVAWLLGLDEMANRALIVANHEEIRKLSPGFWVEYASALHSLGRGTKYEPARLGWKKERYWEPYLAFIADLSSGRETEKSLTMVKAAFEKRNGDRRFLADQYGIEGSGNEPASWDFRLWSLLSLSSRMPERGKELGSPISRPCQG